MKSKCPTSRTFSRSVLSMHGRMEMARSQLPSSLLWSLIAFMAPNLFAASRSRSAELPSPAGRVTYPGHWDHSPGEAGRHSESVCALRLVLSFCSWDPKTAGQPAQPSPWEERVPHHPSHCSRHTGNPSTPAGPAADKGSDGSNSTRSVPTSSTRAGPRAGVSSLSLRSICQEAPLPPEFLTCRCEARTRCLLFASVSRAV